MSMAMDEAIEQIEWFADESPGAVRLARLSSLATRLEPNLLRLLRTELLPDVDVGAEADLWFSPLIESSGTDSIVLDPAIAELLRQDLARDPALLDRVITITRAAHEHLAPALRLEEEVIGLALRGGDDAEAAIDERLQAALRAMTQNADRAGEIARWVLRAWPRLPGIVRATRSGSTLALASTALLRRRSDDSPLDANATLDDVRWVFPEQAFTETVELTADLHEGRVRFTESAGTDVLTVPRTDPPIVELAWELDGSSHRRLAEATAGTSIRLGPDVARVLITTLAGDEYELELGASAADVPAAPKGIPWIPLPEHAVVDACVSLSSVYAPESTETTGFWITSRHVVGARSWFADQDTLLVNNGLVRGEVLAAGDDSPVLIVTIAEDVLQPVPVSFATPGFRASRESPDDGLRAQRTSAIVIGTVDGVRGAVLGSTVIDRIMPPVFVVEVESHEPIPHGFAGGPVIIDDKVCGVVTGIEFDPAESKSTLTVASGSLIQQTMERVTRPDPVQSAETIEQSAAESAAAQQTESPPRPTGSATDAAQGWTGSGSHFARVLIVANDDKQSERVIRSIIGRGQGSFIGPRRALWWIDAGSVFEPSLRAGVLLQTVRTDPLWPVVLDAQGAALIVLTEPEKGDDHGRQLRDTLIAVAEHTPLLTGQSVELAARPQVPSKLRVDAGEDLRSAVVSYIDWSGAPEVASDAFKRARKQAVEQLERHPPVVGLEEHLDHISSTVGMDWYPVLGPLAGQRTVESARLVFRDPDFFETLVLTMSHSIASEQRHGLPAMPVADLERHLWQTMGERIENLAFLPADILQAAAAELEQAGIARTVTTTHGPVIVLPRLMEDRAMPTESGTGPAALRAQWTGRTEEAFLPLLATLAWGDGTIEEIGWDGQSGHGVAIVRRDGAIRVEATRHGEISELSATLAEHRWFDLPATVQWIRSSIEDVLSDNKSLTIDEPGPLGGGPSGEAPPP